MKPVVSVVPFALLSVLVGCAAKTTTTTTIVEEEWTEETTETKEPASSKRVSPPSQVKTGEVTPVSTAQEADPSEVCGSKESREDCSDCCAVLASGARMNGCTNRCTNKPPADDCRVNECTATSGTSCLKCWTGWRCVPGGQTC